MEPVARGSRLVALVGPSVSQIRPAIILMLLICIGLQKTTPALAFSSVLDIDGMFPYLRDNLTGNLREPRDYMDFDSIYTPNETVRLRQTAQGRNYLLLKGFDFANYFQSDYWHYSSTDDLLQSAQPAADPLRCARQLNWLERQLNQSDDVLFRPGRQHINLMTLVDSYGKPETATYYGHGYWLGSYYECKRAQLDVAQFYYEECMNEPVARSADECKSEKRTNEQIGELQDSMPLLADGGIKFRYCIGKAHEVDWPSPQQDNYTPRISYKVGLCLPESCETLTYEQPERALQIERLMRLNLPQYMRYRIQLHGLYCVPDERSPIRQLPLSARIFLSLVCAWLALLLFATCVYSCYKRHQRDIREILTTRTTEQSRDHLALQQQIRNLHCKTDTLSMVQSEGPRVEFSPLPAMPSANGYEAKLLLGKSDTRNDGLADCDGLNNNQASPPTLNKKLSLEMKTYTGLPGGNQTTSSISLPGVQANTSVSNLSHSSRGSQISHLSTWIADSPFTIKLLQALSIKETLMEFQRPPKLLESPDAELKLRVNLNPLDSIKCLCCVLVIFGHIIFIHMQHLSNIIHTIELSHEFYPRILISFFNFVDTFFIISGMLTAYFIFKRFNKRSFSSPLVWLSISLLRLLRLSPVYILVLWFIKTTSVYMTDGPIWDYGTDKNSIKGLCINDHWWKSILYLGNTGSMQPICILPAWSIIVDAQYSLITPVVIYIIFQNKRAGYLLLLVATLISTTKMTQQLAEQTAVKTTDMAKIRLHVYPLISRFAAEFYNTAWNRIGPVAIGIFGGHMLYLYETGKIQRWPLYMRGTAFKAILTLHLFIFALPTIGRFINDPESTSETDTTIFILSNATIKPIWSVINTILLLRLLTDLRAQSVLARLMSHNIWHCLGKLCFTSYLIHYEIILTLLKSRQEGLIDPNWSNALREFSAVFLISTLLSYMIYILYEAPMNKLVTLMFSKHNSSQQRKQQENHI